ncbi:D-sedoheptulose-7-phosphate isomerase [Streptomyces sp. NPDC001780]
MTLLSPGRRRDDSPDRHCDDLTAALVGFRESTAVLQDWGTRLAGSLGAGARLLVAGNGGSAAQAQHLTAELVGRYRDDRPPFSALALHADTSSTTAIANDYGVHEVFARQVCAHGRPGDVLMLLSTSGASANLLTAATQARRIGMAVWSLTGPPPNPLEAISDRALCVRAPAAATVQELHLVAVHVLCEAFDRAVAAGSARRSAADTARDAAGEGVGRVGGDGTGQPGTVSDRVGHTTGDEAVNGAPVRERNGT